MVTANTQHKESGDNKKQAVFISSCTVWVNCLTQKIFICRRERSTLAEKVVVTNFKHRGWLASTEALVSSKEKL